MMSPEIYHLFRDGSTRGHPARIACTIAGRAHRVYEVDPHLPGSLSNNSAGKSAVGELMLSTPPPHAASFIVRWARPLWPRTPPKSPAKLNTLRQVAGRMRVGGCRCHCDIVGACCCAISIEIDNICGCQSCRIGREFP